MYHVPHSDRPPINAGPLTQNYGHINFMFYPGNMRCELIQSCSFIYNNPPRLTRRCYMSMGMNGLARSSSSLVSSFTIACVSENEYNKDNEAHTAQHRRMCGWWWCWWRGTSSREDMPWNGIHTHTHTLWTIRTIITAPNRIIPGLYYIIVIHEYPLLSLHKCPLPHTLYHITRNPLAVLLDTFILHWLNKRATISHSPIITVKSTVSRMNLLLFFFRCGWIRYYLTNIGIVAQIICIFIHSVTSISICVYTSRGSTRAEHITITARWGLTAI